MNTHKESRGIVKTIITMASDLEKSIIAKGVESKDPREMLAGLSC